MASAAASQPITIITGAGILIRYKNWILMGRGGRHVKDNFGKFINPKTRSHFAKLEDLSELQTYDGSFDDAKVHFSKVAGELSEANGQPIQYSTPVLIDGKYKTRFLFIDKKRSKWSIPKGGIHEGETAEQTAIRETEEETGMYFSEIKPLLGGKDGTQFVVEVDKDKDTQYVYSIFTVTIDNPAIIPMIKELTENRAKNHYGELFDVGFAPIDIVLTPRYYHDMNIVTKDAVKEFARQIGVPAATTKKTRRRNRTRKNEGWRKRF